ncbi:glycoside hydrolase family 13 protein [Fodinibius sp.]|uniref:glycoside hydrolase family 13 protein n=1 Tax=Fodinibius sp. TaxID=1872440 RepID=UPI002ACEFBA3|nr:glycoside hydrolase family 13 protein [Fodinibius sp.]MDZ7658822.1 glycoside hydrolase family 13 protein [Fodinibius sp.]
MEHPHDHTSNNGNSVDTFYHAPEWSKHVIWYQIFPERFRNGDPSNDPTRERVGGPKGWKISPWTGDWYKQSEWEKSLGDSFRDGVFKRRYGGDLQGVIDKLDYLQELGISGIYLNPVFDAVSLHKYDTSHYHHIDRFYGPDPEGDVKIMKLEDPEDPDTWQWTSADKLFLKLIEEVHNREMRIIIDGVFNHTGTDFWAFRDVKKYQDQSKYKNWYSINSFADGNGQKFDYDGWWGVKSLPELKEVDGTLVKPVREHIFAITRRWMDPDGDGDPSDGIDGWRLDVPEEVGQKFWKEWNALVRRINPEAYTVGEIWTEKGREWVNGELFTAAMNYPFTEAVQEYMIDQSVSASDFMKRLRSIREGLPEGAELVQQNLMDSHDTPRLASMIVNPGREFDTKTKPEERFDVRKPTPKERRLQRLIALFQYTYVGAPMIFYGTEAGMWGADDPDDRKPMVWPELEYDDEKNHPLDKERPIDENSFDEELFNWYKKLGEIRNKHLALRKGKFQELLTKNDADVFVFARFLNKHMFCLVAVNRSDQTRKIRIPLDHFEVEEGKHLENIITGNRAEVVNSETVITLPPIAGAVLSPEEN